MPKKYEHQFKTYEHEFNVTIYLITNSMEKLPEPPKWLTTTRKEQYYVGQTTNEYARLSKHNTDANSGAYRILKDKAGAMYTLGGVDEDKYYHDRFGFRNLCKDAYESILISLVNYITADFSPYYKSYITNSKDYKKIKTIRGELQWLDLFPIHLNEELIKKISKREFDTENYEQLRELIAKRYEYLDWDSISHWATIMTLADIKASEYENLELGASQDEEIIVYVR